VNTVGVFNTHSGKKITGEKLKHIGTLYKLPVLEVGLPYSLVGDMKMLKVMLIVFAIGYSVNSHADPLTLMGTPSCGQWNAARINDSQHIKSEQYKSWLMGYISGLSFAVNSMVLKADVIKGTDAESVFLWMDNYCKTNPLNSLADGGFALFGELLKRSQ
jgi:hypothetical protein